MCGNVKYHMPTSHLNNPPKKPCAAIALVATRRAVATTRTGIGQANPVTPKAIAGNSHGVPKSVPVQLPIQLQPSEVARIVLNRRRRAASETRPIRLWQVAQPVGEGGDQMLVGV
jgi:hypothetical protein